MSEKQCNYKVVLLGDSSVGKSCLASRFVSDTFCEFQESTIGAAFMTKTLDIGSYKIRFEIWDTAGQERYRSLAPLYYRGAMVAIVIFDITKLNSFEGAKKWVYEIKQNGREDCIIILVGNKIDLEHLRNVENDIIYEYIEEQNIMYFDTSAKSGKNIVHMFEVIGKKLPRDAMYHSRNIKIARAKSASSYGTYYCC